MQEFFKHFFSPKNLFGIIISGGCIYWSFSNFNLDDFFNHVQSINYYFFILASLLLILSVLIRSFRWMLFFKDGEIKNLQLFELFKNEMIGYFGNNIFPLRLGDVLRVTKISKVTKMSQSYLLGTIVAERIIDILSLLIFLLLIFPFFWNSPIVAKILYEFNFIDFEIVYIIIFLLLLLFVYVLFKKTNLIDWNSFVSAFSNLIGFNKIFKIFILSLSVWSIYLLNIIIISCSMPAIENFTFLNSLLLLVFITLSIVVLPAAPGTIGTFQAAVIFIMTSSLFNYSKNEAASFSIILHAYSYITYSIIGGYFFLKSNIDIDT